MHASLAERPACVPLLRVGGVCLAAAIKLPIRGQKDAAGESKTWATTKGGVRRPTAVYQQN
jgi:hypothetical protein